MPLSPEALEKAAQRRPPIDAPVELLDDSVLVRRLSGDDRDAWDVFVIANTHSKEDEEAGRGKEGALKIGVKHYRATMVALGLSDKDGNRVYSDADIPKLGEWDGEVLDALYTVVRKHNGMAADAVEDARKNSESDTPNNGSG
jgi:hypothetical protein